MKKSGSIEQRAAMTGTWQCIVAYLLRLQLTACRRRLVALMRICSERAAASCRQRWLVAGAVCRCSVLRANRVVRVGRRRRLPASDCGADGQADLKPISTSLAAHSGAVYLISDILLLHRHSRHAVVSRRHLLADDTSPRTGHYSDVSSTTAGI